MPMNGGEPSVLLVILVFIEIGLVIDKHDRLEGL